MKLRTKILSYTLPLILIPFLLTALAVHYFIIRANRIQIQEQKNQTLNETLVNFRKEMDTARKDVELLSRVPAVEIFLQDLSDEKYPQNVRSEDLENQAKTALELFFNQNPYYLQLAIVDEKGREKIKFSKIPEEQELKHLISEDYFRWTLILGSVQTPVKEIQPSKFATVFTKSIGEEKFLGMIVLFVNTQVFERSMRPLLRRDLTTFLFDDRGTVLASAFKTNSDKNLLNQIKLPEEAAKILSKSSFEPDQTKLSEGDRNLIFSVFPSETFPKIDFTKGQTGENWFLGVFEPQEAVSIPFGFQMLFFSILFLATAAVFLIASKTSRRITTPLEKVSSATAKIARGDTDINLDIKTGDEVEDLANAFMLMNKDLKHYQKQLIQSAKLVAMGEMTSEISHEIQNRISGISLWLQHLDSEIDPDDPKQEYLNEMKLGLSGFMEMLANLKEYYKKPILETENVDLNSLIEETLIFAKRKLNEKQIEITTEFENHLPQIKGDREKLKSVVLNFLINAVESLEENGKIKIRTESETDLEQKLVILKVCDNGKGIENKDLTRIFYPFYSTKTRGSGLGLAISSNIISAHKGRIEVKSKSGIGTTFKIFLPLPSK